VGGGGIGGGEGGGGLGALSGGKGGEYGGSGGEGGGGSGALSGGKGGAEGGFGHVHALNLPLSELVTLQYSLVVAASPRRRRPVASAAG